MIPSPDQSGTAAANTTFGYISNSLRRDGGYRKIEIKLQEKNLKLTYRKGYLPLRSNVGKAR